MKKIMLFRVFRVFVYFVARLSLPRCVATGAARR